MDAADLKNWCSAASRKPYCRTLNSLCSSCGTESARRLNRAPPNQFLTALSNVATGGTKITSVFVNDGWISAFRADFASHGTRCSLIFWGIKHAHVTQGETFLVKHAQNGIAVNNQSRDIRDRRRP